MFGGEAPGLGLAGTSSGDEEDHGRGPVQGLHRFVQPVRDAALRAGGEIVLGPDGKGEGLPVGLRQVDQGVGDEASLALSGRYSCTRFRRTVLTRSHWEPIISEFSRTMT